MAPKKGNIPWNKGQRGVIHHTEETKRRMSDGHKGQKQWNTGLTKETDERVRKSAEKKLGRPSSQKGKKRSEEQRRKMSIAQRGHVPWNKGIPRSEETKTKISKAKTGRKHTPKSEEQKQKLFLKLSLFRKDTPSSQKGCKRPPRTPEWCKHMSEAKIGVCVGNKNPNWKGGASFEPYDPKFNKLLKKNIKLRDQNKCVMCGATKKRKFYLHCHHIDYNKKNYAENNLITLCPICHSKTNFNRTYWENFFNDLMFFIYPPLQL